MIRAERSSGASTSRLARAIRTVSLAAALFASAAYGATAHDQVFAVGVRAFDAGDLRTAAGLFEACAETGDAGALNNLAVVTLASGGEARVDPVSLLERAEASGLQVATYNLAQLWRLRGDVERATKAYERSASTGFLPAVVHLAIAAMADPATRPADGRKARATLEDAALRGNAAAQYALSVAAARGVHGEVSPAAATHWRKTAAASGFAAAKTQRSPERFTFDDSYLLERTPGIARSAPLAAPEAEDPARAEAWSLSFFDAMSAEHRDLYQKFVADEMRGHVGLRYSRSLSGPGDPLAVDMQALGLMAEVRAGALAGARLYVDYYPRAEALVDGEAYHVERSHILFGWAFGFASTALVDRINVTPKIGSYTLDARVPSSRGGPGAGPVAIQMSGEPALGLELDAEISRLWYVVRASVARDIPALMASQAASRGGTVETTKVALDLLLKGAGHTFGGSRVSLAYLLFVAREQLRVETAGAVEETLEIDLPLAGLGVSVSW